MKKLLLCLLLILFTLTSCKIENEYTTYENGYDVTIATELKEYMLNPTLPSLHFDMPNLNVSTLSTNYKVVLVHNDYEKLSDAFYNHLKKVKGYVITKVSEQTRDEKEALFGGKTLKLDSTDEFGNDQKYSKEIRMVAWMEDGTRYSYQFRTFVSSNKRYFTFCYSEALTFVLEQSMMVIEKEGKNRLALIPLPYDTKYEVSGSNLTVDALINRKTYLDEKYYTFTYPTSLQDVTLDEKANEIKKWYETYCNLKIEKDKYIIEYYGLSFELSFGHTKTDANGVKHDAFKLTFIE